MRQERDTPDHRVARVAAAQYGVVTFDQLRRAGLSAAGVRRRVVAGRLFPVHRAVYAVGQPALSSEGRWLAAVLALGRGAALSHRSAAELWELLRVSGQRPHVTVPSTAGRSPRSGLIVHRSASLTPGDVTQRGAIPVTSVARTLADLSGVVPAYLRRRAVRQAEFLGYETGMETDRTRSDPEAVFLRLCRRHRLPAPEVNADVGGYTVDFLWRDLGLGVEVDGYSAHRGKQAFEDDRRRELVLHGLGVRLRRFSADQIDRSPAEIARSGRADVDFLSLSDDNPPNPAP